MKFIFYRFLSILLICLISSCFPSKSRNLEPRDQDLFNKVGFSPGKRPGERPQSVKAPVKVVPDYYYRAVPAAAPVITNTVSKRYAPASRFYSNPYALKPPANFPFYDSDHYYTPPKGLSGVNRNNIDNRDSRGSGYVRAQNYKDRTRNRVPQNIYSIPSRRRDSEGPSLPSSNSNSGSGTKYEGGS